MVSPKMVSPVYGDTRGGPPPRPPLPLATPLVLPRHNDVEMGLANTLYASA